MKRDIGAIAAVCLALWALPAGAEISIETVNACITKAAEDGTNPNLCVDQAHTDCGAIAEDMHTVATLCFTEAQQVWGDAISTKLAEVQAKTDENIGAVAAIETKYDVLSALVQCDRMEELSRLTESTADLVQRQKAGCQSTASGLAYVRLFWRSRALK